jgi:CubicO group peptidase (beta-lactamase class C family)
MEDFIRTRIFDKAGMNESVSRFSELRDHSDVSAAHSRIQGIVQQDKQYYEQAIGDAGDPAGGIASNAVDMSKWLITQLDSGLTANGNRIFDAAATKELWNVVTPIPVDKAPAGLEPSQIDFAGYALEFVVIITVNTRSLGMEESLMALCRRWLWYRS